MKYLFVLVILIVFSLSCNKNPIIRDIKNNLNRKVELGFIDSVRCGNEKLSYDEFRKIFNYISIVFLEDGCTPCYPKFIEWHNKIDSINPKNNYTILFIIQGVNYKAFINKVSSIEIIEDHFYSIMDNRLAFLRRNNDIPRWIIDGSILVDKEDEIKMIGEPWKTSEMMDLFMTIIH